MTADRRFTVAAAAARSAPPRSGPPALARLMLVAVLAPIAVAACAGSSDDRQTEVVSVFAAASLTDAFAAAEAAYEAANPGVDVKLNLGGSSSLRAQILSGAPADVFASASVAIMAEVIEAGEAEGRPQTFATNRLQLAVPKGNPAGVADLADLADPDLFVGLCASEVPCGALADQLLAAAGIEPSIDSREPDVRALATKIAAGELDAGLVYRTDVLALEDTVDGVDLSNTVDGADPSNTVDGVDPSDTVPGGPGSTGYPIVVLAGADNPGGGGGFVSFVLSAEGRRIMADHGFGPP